MLHVKPKRELVTLLKLTVIIKVSAAPDTLKEYFLTPLSVVFSKYGEVKKYQCKERILLMAVLGKVKAVVCKILNLLWRQVKVNKICVPFNFASMLVKTQWRIL